MLLEELAEAVRAGGVDPVALVGMAFERIDSSLNAWSFLDEARALQAAAARPSGPLAGIPFGVKDLEDCRGMPTGRGSRWFTGRPAAARDDLHVARLRAAGAIPIGKTTTPEFGSSAWTSSLVQGPTRNPWDRGRTPGGSSGGSAVAVATGTVPFCTASDGGGSIRTPACFVGLPGLRPSYGRVPTFGSTHMAQNAVNFALAPTVTDTALLLDVCAGPSAYDRTCLPPPGLSYRQRIEELDVRGLRVAYTDSYGLGPVAGDVGRLVAAALSQLCDVAGLARVEVDLTLPDFFAVYQRVEGVDRWVGLPEGLWPDRASELDPSLQQSWASGARARLPQLGEVYTARRRLEQQVAGWWQHTDIVMTPAAAIEAFGAEGPVPDEIDGSPVHPSACLIQPILPSLCNLPAVSVPVGLTSAGLPAGMQIIAPLHREDLCLRLAYLFEQAVGWPVLPSEPWIR